LFFVCISIARMHILQIFIDGSILPCKIFFLYYYLNLFKERGWSLFKANPIRKNNRGLLRLGF